MNVVINLKDKFDQFSDQWSPKIIASLNGQYVKLAKIEGEFLWHAHDEEDELFFVIKGTLCIEMDDKTVEITEGEMYIVPKGVMHKPYTKHGEVHVLLFEPMETTHTGSVVTERTVSDQSWI
ncbi:MAG: cupin domain-containing protein [Saprospiraceae bacterium]|nr:cupin domain-containing protein [Saprospiraceae bacterium]